MFCNVHIYLLRGAQHSFMKLPYPSWFIWPYNMAVATHSPRDLWTKYNTFQNVISLHFHCWAFLPSFTTPITPNWTAHIFSETCSQNLVIPFRITVQAWHSYLTLGRIMVSNIISFICLEIFLFFRKLFHCSFHCRYKHHCLYSNHFLGKNCCEIQNYITYLKSLKFAYRLLKICWFYCLHVS